MNSSGKYDFRQFQEELAALERQAAQRKAPEPEAAPETTSPPPAKARRGRPPKVDPLAEARAAFEQLRVSHQLSVADVVSWFPEEEGIAYLQSLIASTEARPRKRRARTSPEAE